MLCSGRLFHCAVRGAPAVGGECGVDLVAQASAIVGPRGNEIHDLEQVGCKVQDLGLDNEIEAIDRLAPREQTVYLSLIHI